MSPSIHLLVNPSSNGGRCGRRLADVVSRLQDAGCDVRVQMSRSLEHARELAGSPTDEEEITVAMGGDGMVSAVAGAVADGDRTGSSQAAVGPRGRRFGVIPGGRGNDFARWLGISDVDAAIEALTRGKDRNVDLGYVNGKSFTCVASLGFDSCVMESVERTRFIRGAGVYPYATVKALIGWRAARFKVTLDGIERDLRGYNIVVANGGSYGGGMKIAPDAQLDDGLLDVVAITDIGRIGFLRQAPKIFRGTHIRHPAVEVFRARDIEVTSDPPFTIIADGETAGPSPMSVTVRPGVLTVMSPGN